MDRVQLLEKQLREAKRMKADQGWLDIVDNFEKIGNYLVGKDIIQYYTRYSWSVMRVTGYHEKYYADGSGFHGQWDKRRYFVFKGQRFGMNVDRKQQTFSTNGAVKFDEIKKDCNVYMGHEYDTLGIPIKPKEKWATAWSRFLEIGECKFDSILLEVGEPAYKSRNSEQARTTLNNFKLFLRLAPEGMFDELKEHYVERLRLANKLAEKYHDQKYIESKEIDWKKVLK